MTHQESRDLVACWRFCPVVSQLVGQRQPPAKTRSSNRIKTLNVPHLRLLHTSSPLTRPQPQGPLLRSGVYSYIPRETTARATHILSTAAARQQRPRSRTSASAAQLTRSTPSTFLRKRQLISRGDIYNLKPGSYIPFHSFFSCLVHGPWKVGRQRRSPCPSPPMHQSSLFVDLISFLTRILHLSI